MVINAADYNWTQGEIASMSVAGEIDHVFDNPVLLYGVTGNGSVKIDTETETIYEGTLPYDFPEPIACTSLKFSSESAEVSFIGLVDSRVWWLDAYRNTSSGMTVVAENVDDKVYSVSTGINGFYFDGSEISTIYVSTNHFVGFGSSTEHLKIFRRDGRSSKIYSQTVTNSPISFCKIRWEGYTVYSQQVEQYRLIYELFLLANGDMVLDVLQAPTTKYDNETSSLTYDGTTKTLSLSFNGATGKIVSFYKTDDTGKAWNIVDKDYGIKDDLYLYLVEIDGKFYSVTDGVFEVTPITALKAKAFVEYGGRSLPTPDLLSENPKIFLWAPINLAKRLRWKATATPHPQELTCAADMSDSSIIGISSIEAVYTGDVKVSHKVTGGEWTEQVTLSDWAAQDCAALYASLGEDGKIELKFYLYGDALLTSFTITYINEGGT